MTGKKNDARTGPSVGRRTSAAIVLAVACGSGTALGQSSGDFNGDGRTLGTDDSFGASLGG